jgi:WD40 repeat protein
LNQFFDHSGTVNSCKFNSDGTCLATCSNDRTIKLYDLRCKKLIQHYDAHGEPVTAIDFHSREDKLLSTSIDGKIKIWDTKKASL